MANQFNLTFDQLAQLSTLTNSSQQDFYLGYGYIYSIIKDSQSVDSATKFWFQGASQINSSASVDPANVYVRGVTDFGRFWDGLVSKVG